MDKLLDVRTIAEYLGVSEVTVYRKAREGEIPGVRVGRKWKFSLEIINEWLKNNAGKKLGTWKYEKSKKSNINFNTYKCEGMKGGLSREELYGDR